VLLVGLEAKVTGRQKTPGPKPKTHGGIPSGGFLYTGIWTLCGSFDNGLSSFFVPSSTDRRELKFSPTLSAFLALRLAERLAALPTKTGLLCSEAMIASGTKVCEADVKPHCI
jgi:hypothetical protein